MILKLISFLFGECCFIIWLKYILLGNFGKYFKSTSIFKKNKKIFNSVFWIYDCLLVKKFKKINKESYFIILNVILNQHIIAKHMFYYRGEIKDPPAHCVRQ
jgi:hypothetical protein